MRVPDLPAHGASGPRATQSGEAGAAEVRAKEPDAAALFATQRDFLLGVAYRILGRVADAEDVVQEAWLRWAGVRPEDVTDPRAFLVRVTTRLAIDRLRRIKARREAYVGSWLPEPLLTRDDVAQDVERAESVSMALLVVLETLSPLERAVFVLREAFGFSFAEIAQALGRGEAAVRQLAHRARAHVDARRPRFDADPAARRRVTEQFLAASTTGDLGALMNVLAPGVTLVADGGGLVRAPLLPIYGADKVARFLLAVREPHMIARFLGTAEPPQDLAIQHVHLNGGPGILITAAGAPAAAVALDVADGKAQTIYLLANPRKLAVLGRQQSVTGAA